MNRRALVCALLLAFASHAHATQYNFDYTTDGGNVMGIDRVFDDGQNTVVAFYGPLGGERPTVTTETGSVLPYRVVDRYLVLPGIQRRVMVYARGVVAQVAHGRVPNLSLPPAYSLPAPAPAPTVTRQVAAAPLAPVAPQSAPVPTAAAVGAVTNAVSTTVAAASSPAPDNSRFLVTDEAPPPPEWKAISGASLRNTTEQWAKRAGWQVQWRLDDGADYETVATRAQGEFLQALRQLYAPYLQAEVASNATKQSKPIRVAAYTRQKVLVISE